MASAGDAGKLICARDAGKGDLCKGCWERWSPQGVGGSVASTGAAGKVVSTGMLRSVVFAKNAGKCSLYREC